jgi:lysyl-tRNA synthetase class I
MSEEYFLEFDDERFDYAFVPYDVTCARCGKVLTCVEAFVEEGDEWECPQCWVRCEAADRDEARKQ